MRWKQTPDRHDPSEKFTHPDTGKELVGPKGTFADLAFLESCGIDPWSSFGMITYVIGECPWRTDGTFHQCDRDRHQWTGEVVSRRDGTRVLTSRTCSKCDAIGDPLELDL